VSKPTDKSDSIPEISLPPIDHVVAAITGHATSTIQGFVQRLAANLSRTQGLLELYKGLSPKAPEEVKVTLDDLLRAVTVFLHAALEDLLRAVAEVRLPKANNEALGRIPLSGCSNYGRIEKFTLAQLAVHRGKTVDTVIEDSVREYLGSISFNNTTDIAGILRTASVDIKTASKHFPLIDEMIRRRHQIVHQANSTDSPSESTRKLATISYEEVDRWLLAVKAFAIDVLSELGMEAAKSALATLLKTRSPTQQ
jgi:hypothetical protein